MPGLFGPEMEILARSLDWRALRQGVISANLAHADTPGSKAVKVAFEEILAQRIAARRGEGLRTTDPRHFAAPGPGPDREPRLERVEQGGRLDGNTVDVDRTMVELTKNQLLYDAGAESLSRMLRLLEYAVEEGGR